MKDLWKSGVLLLLIIGVLYIIFLRECKNPISCPPVGQVLVPQSSWDSIKALADKPPVVTVETLKIKGPIVYVPVTPPPQPDPLTPEINSYADSLVNDSIDVHYDFKVKGLLLSRSWSFRPITRIVNKETLIYVPKIVEVEKIVEKPLNGLYLYGTAGGNAESFLFGGGVDYLTKKETQLGYQYQRLGSTVFHSVKIGAKIQFKRK